MEIQSHSTEQNSYPQALSNDLVTQELGKETLVYNLKTNQAYCLNETTVEVWRACDGTRSVAEISQLLSRRLHTKFTEDLVWLALEQLKKNELLADHHSFAINFQGLSRRAMLKRAGLATVVALPAIASIVAPAAAQAASGTGNGNTNGACTSNCLLGTCSCPTGSITCAPGHLVSATVGLGLCVDVGVAASALGVGVAAGVNGNVCLIATACLL